MGRLTAPSRPLTTEDTEDAEEFSFTSVSASDLRLLSGLVFLALTFFFSLCSGACPERRRVSSVAILFLLFLSNFAIASANQGAFTAPRDAGRLLVHFAEPWSPAMSAILRPVRADSSYCSMS